MDFELGTMWPRILAGIVIVLCVIYVYEVVKSKRKRQKLDLEGVEGFVGGAGGIDQRIDDKCYDLFYAKVYDALVQPTARAALETKVALEWLDKAGRVREDLRVADIGCGTGIHVELFARERVRSVTGFDKSADMIAQANRMYVKETGEKEGTVSPRTYLVGDATVATMATAEQFDLISMYYFTIYMVPDRTQMLKNIFLWLAPGGVFVVHIVNKLKFDPVLESASPFVGFSVQKYADERITKSTVTFDEFEYTGDFQLHGSRAMYEEEFKFKDGSRRRHEQRVWMPNIDAIVAEITGVGFKMAHHSDMTAIGYEYQYLFIFQK